ncbi:MAG: hypothetical protein GEU86_04205 [Actinophytocola sp.]|nr:hypothetical protein [Actinophytocola sp.]
MSVMTSHTLAFTDEAARDVSQTGGKGAGLAEMTGAGLPVAPGFVVTASAYHDFLDANDLRTEIAELLASGADVTTIEAHMSERLASTTFPAAIEEQVRVQYAALCDQVGLANVPVAVRSSATAEDSAGNSFAGEFETWVDVAGADSVVEHVLRCYASVFTGRVLDYAIERGIDLADVEMAVVVQKTVRARAAGVMFTLDPISGDRSRIVLEASWGLGLAVVGGEVNPDRYVVAKVGMAIVEQIAGDKHLEYRDGHGTTEVAPERRTQLCLTDEEVLALATLGKQIEKHNGCPQDIEFAVDEDLPKGANIILLQCRPETVWGAVQRKPVFDSGAGVMSWITGTISGATSTPKDRHSHG